MESNQSRSKKSIRIAHSHNKQKSPFSLLWNRPYESDNSTTDDEDSVSFLKQKKMSWFDEHAESFRIPISIHTWHIIVFALLIVVITVPIAISAYATSIEVEKGELRASLSNTIFIFQSAINAAKEGEIKSSQEMFVQAHSEFANIEYNIRKNHPFVAIASHIAPDQVPGWQSVINALEAGRLAAKAGVMVTDSLSLVQEKNVHLTDKEVTALVTVTGEVEHIISNIRLLIDEIDPSILPDKDRSLVYGIQNTFPGIESAFREAVTFIHFTAGLLGFTDGEKKILFVFHNNAELRPTGGFMGSYAMVKVRNGQVTLVDVPGGGTYDFQGTVRSAYASPEALHLINPVWQFQDANWWPDWQASAEKISWFYEQGNGATVDYIIGVTPTVLEGLLRITGPITLDAERGIVVDSRNVYAILQERPTEDVGDDKPKEIVTTGLQAIFERAKMLNTEEIQQLLPYISKSLSEKHILLYAKDAPSKNVIQKNNWGGDIKQTSGDFVMAVHTNIAGGKSDRDITDRMHLESRIDEKGSIVNELTVTRTHHGKSGYGFGGVRNVDYLRVYVPRESELLGVHGAIAPPEDLFEKVPDGLLADPDIARYETIVSSHEASGTTIMRSFGKTVFANWLMVDPGESTSVTFTYRLPFTISGAERHSILASKQPGLDGVVFEYALTTPRERSEDNDQESQSFQYKTTDIMTEDIKREITIRQTSL